MVLCFQTESGLSSEEQLWEAADTCGGPQPPVSYSEIYFAMRMIQTVGGPSSCRQENLRPLTRKVVSSLARGLAVIRAFNPDRRRLPGLDQHRSARAALPAGVANGISGIAAPVF